jgi:hypothetical protein
MTNLFLYALPCIQMSTGKETALSARILSEGLKVVAGLRGPG